MGRYLSYREEKGKEDGNRLLERQGISSCQRPTGGLVWLHAASVGESVSLLPVIEALSKSKINVLLTTGTVTSATLMDQKLPDGVIHQYYPVDIPQWVDRFLDYWRPSVAVFTESELWPNMILSCKSRKIPLILANARLSQRSFSRWQKAPVAAHAILSAFDVCIAQSSDIANRLLSLGAKDVRVEGNLKFAGLPLTVNTEFHTDRRVWAAVSTHDGEEEIVLKAHLTLQKSFPELLTILVPRHPDRADSIIQLIQSYGLTYAQRSKDELPTADIYLADTMGELGLFYHVSPISLVGGSLVPVGGHNPIEAIKLGSCVVMGPHVHNCSDITDVLGDSIVRLNSANELAETVKDLMQHPEKQKELTQKAQAIVEAQQNSLENLLSIIMRYHHENT